LYAMHSVDDVRAAVDLLQQRYGLRRVVLIGVCSGAYLSFHSALQDPRVDAIAMVNPQTFTWHEGDSLQLRSRQSIRSVRFYWERLFEAATWVRLLKGHIDTRRIMSGLAAILRKRLASRMPALGAAAPAPELNVKSSFRGLLHRGVRILLIYSGEDGGLNEMEAWLGKDAAALRRYDNFQLEIVDGADHTLTPRWAQRQLLRMLVQKLTHVCGQEIPL
jgi:pimeloyl-ACP methyl ester carboxylesterase